MNKIAIQRRCYPVVKNTLERSQIYEEIKRLSGGESLDFELSTIAQYLDENDTEDKLTRQISKIFNLSFDATFKPRDFEVVAREILQEYKHILQTM